MRRPYTLRMHKSLRMAALAIGAVFLAGSLAAAAQTPPPPAPDAGTTPQHHTKTGKGKKHSGKKGGKKGRKKNASTNPK
jgi:hypothetical protein